MCNTTLKPKVDSMYSATIKPKVDSMFQSLQKKIFVIINNSISSDEAITTITEIVSSELSSRSKSILSDMLFDLSDATLATDFFADISRQNKFYAINLRQEILNKYQFTPSTSINFQEVSRTTQALKIGGATFVIGGAAELGAVLINGLSLSRLLPLPIGLLIAASIGAALTQYYAIAPAKNKKTLEQAINTYLEEVQKQFFNWFDEIEKYFYMRVEEIKQTM